MVNPPTDRQLAVLKFWNDFRIENGYQPSLQEICSHFSFRAKGAASGHLKALERKGIIERTPKKNRAIKLTELGKKLLEENS
jgi:repressor LexA